MMNDVRWEMYPLVATSEVPRAWLQIQAHLQLAPKTIDAYGRSLNDFLDFCGKAGVIPEEMGREQVASYVHDLTTRPNSKGSNILQIASGTGLANATMQLRITVLRLFCDFLIEKRLRSDNPVGRGHFIPGKAFGGYRERGLLSSYQKLPWIPSDEEWLRILGCLKEEILRNQVMFLLAYDGALRREELVTVAISDFDFAYKQIRIRAECAKNGSERVVGYSQLTSRSLEAYLLQRRELSTQKGPLFLSESRRNEGQPLSLVMWSKIVQQLALRATLPRFTTHTTRHLRLTHLARAHMDLHQISLYAGHRSLQTTMLYIHLSGVELTEAIARSLAGFEQWMSCVLEITEP